MDSSKILSADILDILFEGRNKEYGAYDLRKTYNRRLIKAMGTMGAVILLLFTGYYVSSQNTGKDKMVMMVTDTELTEVSTEKKELPPLPPPPKVEPPKIKIIQFTPPKIMPDKDVNPNERPPVQDDLVDTKIGTVNADGAKDDGFTAPPPSDGGKGVVEAPKKVEEDLPFTKVEFESTYPTGMPGWQRYLNKYLHYPDEAVNNEIQGVVVVQFIVDTEGNVSDVEAVSGPSEGGLREEAVRVIKKSGKWTPAIQNGRQVKSYKKQPITFKLGGDQ
jgi:protein TonB